MPALPRSSLDLSLTLPFFLRYSPSSCFSCPPPFPTLPPRSVPHPHPAPRPSTPAITFPLFAACDGCKPWISFSPSVSPSPFPPLSLPLSLVQSTPCLALSALAHVGSNPAGDSRLRVDGETSAAGSLQSWGAAELHAIGESIGAGPLVGVPLGAAAARVRLLAFVGRALREVLPLVDLGRAAAAARVDDCSLAAELHAGRGRFPPSVLSAALLAVVDEARRKGRGSIPSVRVNRGTVSAEKRRADRTVFMQIFRQVRAAHAHARGWMVGGAGRDGPLITIAPGADRRRRRGAGSAADGFRGQ